MKYIIVLLLILSSNAYAAPYSYSHAMAIRMKCERFSRIAATSQMMYRDTGVLIEKSEFDEVGISDTAFNTLTNSAKMGSTEDAYRVAWAYCMDVDAETFGYKR